MANVNPNHTIYAPAVEWAMEVLGPEAIITEVSTFRHLGEACVLVTGLVGTSYEEVAFTLEELIEHILKEEEEQEGDVEDGGKIIIVK